MSKMTVDLPPEIHKDIKISAIKLGKSIKDYIIDIHNLSKRIMIRDDGKIRILNDETIAALEESRRDENKLPKYDSVEDLMKDLKS